MQSVASNAVEEQKSFMEEFRIILPDYTTKIIRSFISPHYDFIENKSILVGTAQDVTDHKQFLTRLQLSESKFRSLFDSSPDAIYVEDNKGNILDVNAEACKIQGYAREDLIGKNILDLTPPEYKKNVSENFLKLFEQEKSIHESFTWDKNWTPTPVEIRVNKIQYGGKDALLLHVRDISQRKKTEHDRYTAEKKFSLLVETAPVGIFQLNLDRELTFVNDRLCEIFGMARAELLQGKGWSLIHPDDKEAIFKKRQKANETQEGIQSVFRITVNGKEKKLFGQSKEVTDENGRTVEYIGTIVDITYLQSLEVLIPEGSDLS
jgi:PAS domain S-box-containing protein